MSDFYPKTPIRIPVKLVDGIWEFFYGGSLPVCNGSIGELILEKHSIEDKNFLSQLLQKWTSPALLDVFQVPFCKRSNIIGQS